MSAHASLRKGIQFSDFLHQRILILRRLANQPRSGLNPHSLSPCRRICLGSLPGKRSGSFPRTRPLQFDKVVYQIQTRRSSLSLRKARVTVCLNEKGEVTILWNGKSLPYFIFKRQSKQSEIVLSKEITGLSKPKTKPTSPSPITSGVLLFQKRQRSHPTRGLLYLI